MRPLRRVDLICLLSFFLPPAEPVSVRCGRPGGGVVGEEAAVGSGGAGGHGEWIQTGRRAQTLLPTGFNTTNLSLRYFMSQASKSIIMCRHRALRFIWVTLNFHTIDWKINIYIYVHSEAFSPPTSQPSSAFCS